MDEMGELVGDLDGTFERRHVSAVDEVGFVWGCSSLLAECKPVMGVT